MQRQQRQTIDTQGTSRPADPAHTPVNREPAEEALIRRVSVSLVRKAYKQGLPVHVGDGLTEIVKLPAFSVGKKVLIPVEGSELFWARLRNAPPKPIRRKTGSAA